MATFEDQLKSFQSLDIWKITKDVIMKHKEKVLDLQRGQLWDGKTKFNTDIRPLYSEDPFFKSKKQAIAYRSWKNKITKNSDRNPDAPNLYINGYYYSLITMIQTGDALIIGAGGFGADFDDKWKNIYGLTPENLAYLKQVILPEIQQQVKKHLKV